MQIQYFGNGFGLKHFYSFSFLFLELWFSFVILFCGEKKSLDLFIQVDNGIGQNKEKNQATWIQTDKSMLMYFGACARYRNIVNDCHELR